jgi:ataxia telangiectasia mutated family protein
MEQLFSLVNGLIAQDKEASARDLRMRTYCVVPLSPRVGLIEWVHDSVALHHILNGEGVGLHTRLRVRPRNSFKQWMAKFKEAYDNNKASLPKVMDDAFQDFQPLLHRYFLEQYPQPSDWFHRRLSYTRSVAVSSIVGFVVGLGDRHCQNILVDQRTAELVHIDLGVAFDYGRHLRTPENVPFRLTRDVIDGMGITGVEGAFRRSCEATLRLLRGNEERLVTVLEVFMYDPLYKWSLSPSRVQQLRPDRSISAAADGSVSVSQVQGTAGDSAGSGVQPDSDAAAAAAAAAGNLRGPAGNASASRLLEHVKDKLRGLRTMEQHRDMLSVEGQVNTLIAEARDLGALKKMYHGWAPFI